MNSCNWGYVLANSWQCLHGEEDREINAARESVSKPVVFCSPSDFKTPTRIPRSRSGGVFSGESPHNDSDFQQDIIWDATSPSPNRRGKPPTACCHQEGCREFVLELHDITFSILTVMIYSHITWTLINIDQFIKYTPWQNQLRYSRLFNKVPDDVFLLQRQLIRQSVNRELIHNSLDVLMWLASCQVFIRSAGFDLRDVFLLQEKEERSSVLELWTSRRSSAGSLQRSVT